MNDPGVTSEYITNFEILFCYNLNVAGQFVKHKLPDLLRSYIDAGKSSVTF